MIIYTVNNRYTFTHYGKAISFARKINGEVRVVKTNNLLKYILAAL